MGKRSKRRTRSNFENRKTKGLVNKPQSNSTDDDPKETQNSPDGAAILSRPTTPSTYYQQDHPHNTDQDGEYRMRVIVAVWRFVARRFIAVVGFLDKYHGAVTALATVAIVMLTFVYVKYSKKQWETMQDTLQVSQRAYVTIGRKDGVVADFVVPKDPNQNAELLIYFQNSGRLPAKFSWGTMVSFLGQGSKKKSGIILTHPYNGLSPRTRDKKNGSIGEGGESTVVAGDSIFVSTLGSITQKDLADLPANDPGLLILGMFEYCDELGSHSIRSFGLRYRNNAPTSSLSFDLAQDTAFPILPLPKDTVTTEYLFPCETSSERERSQSKTRQ